VALGGDTIEVKNGKLIINGKPLKTEWVEKKTMMAGEKVEGDVFWETNGNARYQIFISKQNPQKGDFGPVKVPPYHCFVMGDNRNRNHSKDSRAYGALSNGAIEGKFWSIYWPYHRRAVLDAEK
jgi:signal peptidase I